MKTSFANQLEVANTIIEDLNSSGLFQSVILTGSLTTQAWDVLSDIDIVLSSSNKSPHQLINEALQTISHNYKIWFTDWALSLLPEKYVLSVYFSDFPTFWQIDLTSYHSKPWASLNRADFKQDPVYHIFKLWICNAKQQLRKNVEKNYVDIMFSRLFDTNKVEANNLTKFKATLNWLNENSTDTKLIKACNEIMNSMELNEKNKI